MNELHQILMQLRAVYPESRLTDYIKYIYENEFGGEKPVDDSGDAIQKESETAAAALSLIEPIGNNRARINLKNAADSGLSPKTLHRITALSAFHTGGSPSRYYEKLNFLRQMCENGELQFSSGMWNLYMVNYQAAGFPPVSHSRSYIDAYAPSYRIIDTAYADRITVFCEIDRLLCSSEKPITVAIDGALAAGKTYLSTLISHCYDCRVFHSESCFDTDSSDWENALMTERFEKLMREYRADTDSAAYRRLTIVEGAFCAQPKLRGNYDLIIALDIDKAHQTYRLKKQHSISAMEAYIEKWIPMEKEYFEDTGLFKYADIIFQ